MEACPVCRAALNGASTCRRCRAELARAQEVERLGQRLTGAAMLALAQGDPRAAGQWLRRARAVHATPAVRILEQMLGGAYASRPDLPRDVSCAADTVW